MGVHSCTGPKKEGGVAGYLAEWGGQMLGWGVHANSNTVCSSEEYKHST